MFSSLHRLRTSLCCRKTALFGTSLCRRKTQRYLCTKWRAARICSLAAAHCVTYIGKVMNREMGNTGALVSQPQTFITRPYLYGLFRRERRTSAARGKAEENKVSPARGRKKARVFYLTYFHPIWTTRREELSHKLFLCFVVSVHERRIYKKKRNKEGPQFIFNGALCYYTWEKRIWGKWFAILFDN